MSVFDYEAFRKTRIRPENEIIAKWKGSADKPVVSIVCTAFNHESYIEDAIKGFLIQETDFPFEIIIHDDASFDGTIGIIDKYKAEYPNIIKCIIQSENQYSKGNNPLEIAFRSSSGSFIAICEGDDYWISNYKLQRQYDALSEFSDINICIHPSWVEKSSNGVSYNTMGPYKPSSCVIESEDVVRGGGNYCATASIMIRADFVKNLPEWVYRAPITDYFLQGLGSFENGALFLIERMCVYRSFALGSWSGKISSTYIPNKLLSAYEIALSEYDRATQYKYSLFFKKQIAAWYQSGAVSSIRFSSKYDFKERIIKSNQFYPQLDVSQSLLYTMKNFYPLIRLLYRLVKYVR